MVTKALITAEEFMSLPDNGQRWELIEGEACPMSAAGAEHGRAGMRLGSRLLAHSEQHQLGEVFNADTGFRLRRDPDTVRLPDVSFVSRERWNGVQDREAYFEGPPDLAVE
ncbi:MAG: Uma2 family endonuclease, partial [Chloroflexota bacterium]|nr:Uma2 family endonuclease [Chloroflexota bacterium]